MEELCDFCDENPGVEFVPDWDAFLCDECIVAQDDALRQYRS